MARAWSRLTQLTTLRFTGPSAAHVPSARKRATSTTEHSGSQQQLTSQAWARRLQTQEQSNLVHGLRSGAGCEGQGRIHSMHVADSAQHTYHS